MGTTAFGATANNPISDVQGVTIIADTKGRDRLYGATVRLDLGKIALSDLRSMQVGFESITDIFSAEQRPVQVTVIVPSSELMFAQQQLKPEVVKIFRQRFGA